MPFELCHDFSRLESPPISPELFHQAGCNVQQRNVLDDHTRDAGTQHLDGNFTPARKDCKVYLRYGSACRCDRVEVLEYLFDRKAISTLDGAIDLLYGKRGNLILQLGQLVGDVQRNQITSRGQYLAEFDEYGPERLQCQSQPLATRAPKMAPEQRRRQQGTQHAHTFMTEDKFVESVAQ